MNLENIPTIKGATHAPKRPGRGEGSGHGKTQRRGHGDKKAPAAVSRLPEGGQNATIPQTAAPWFQQLQLPHQLPDGQRRELDKLEGTEVTRGALIAAGLIRDNQDGQAAGHDAEVSKAFTVTVDKVSPSAKAKTKRLADKSQLPGS